MSSKVIVILEDDLDGAKADQTVEFALDGAAYAIDLSDSNAKMLRGALEGYVSKARRMSGKALQRPQDHQLRHRQPCGPALG